MKNIHVLTTDKPNFGKYLVLNKEGKLCIWNTNTMGSQKTLSTQHIYITSDEEIKEGDWVLSFLEDESYGTYFKIEENHFYCGFDFEEDFKKIILTTDQDLINDGVQAIPDEFLEWFVKNPSCEEINVETEIKWKSTVYDQPDIQDGYIYKIIIPKEELPQFGTPQFVSMCENTFWGAAKQETLEEAAENYSEGWGENNDEKSFVAGAKWQAERMYSEEEVLEILEHHTSYLETFIYQYVDKNDIEVNEEWFKQFKKKQ